MRIKISWRDLLYIMGAIPQLAAQWPAVRVRIAELAEHDMLVAPFLTMLESLLDLYRDDGRLSWRDLLQIFAGIGPVAIMWAGVRARLDELVHDDPVLVPFYAIMDELRRRAVE